MMQMSACRTPALSSGFLGGSEGVVGLTICHL